MPPSIRTLRDLERGNSAADDDTSTTAAPKQYKSHNRDIQIAHIPGLREDNHAKSLLDRIHKEFLPLLQKRGYNVKSVSEMCCCADGLDSKQHRKKKIMPPNVLGYNQSYFRGGYKSHTIHLRLRQPTNHEVFYDYESIAATMSHELAHCEIGPHNAKFYKLMEEIQEQHAVFLTKGQVLDKNGFPMGSDQAYSLGNSSGSVSAVTKKTSADSRKSALAAALQRQKRQHLTGIGGQRLGGTSGEFAKWLRPGEAAAQAAEERRLRDEVWCQPCEPEIIELSDDEEEEENSSITDSKLAAVPSSNSDKRSNKENEDKKKSIKRDSKATQTKERQVSAVARMPSSSDSSLVDLTGSDDEAADTPTPGASLHRPTKQQRRALTEEWACAQCTFRNAQLALVCAICGDSKHNLQASLELAQRLQAEEGSRKKTPTPISREQQIKRVKEQEVAQSVRDFGFNIYGTNKMG